MLKDNTYSLRDYCLINHIVISPEEKKELEKKLRYAYTYDKLVSIRVSCHNDRYMDVDMMSHEEYGEYVNRGGQWHFSPPEILWEDNPWNEKETT